MGNIQINNIQMPTLREMPEKSEVKVDKGFRFTLLSQIEESQLQDKLTQMVEEITQQGAKIAEHMDIKDMKIYRSLIANFMQEVISNSHKFSRENFLDRRGRHRVYGIVRLVNQKIDELAQELLKAEKNHVRILEKIGEIEGLILDIFT